MKNYLPDRNCLFILRVIITVVSAVLIVAVKYFFTVDLLVMLISTIIGAGAFFVMFAYLPMFLESIKYTLTESEIITSGGVIMQIHKSVKYSSIQYTNVITTPFSQYTGLNFIICFVYGGQIRMLFLNHSDAKEILERVERKGEQENCITNTP
ncbi:MAG: PH domain-containing protein [Prevotella sp.]|nr:PH domain-containing protein [Alistipes senegalensis]MCM1358446.1 PH domain-containing protein [Prevotella sp.]MCM1474328.1 PH domain-containing protein [Muribaculaceae bacterium]